MRGSRMLNPISSKLQTLLQSFALLALVIGASAQTNPRPLVELYTDNQGMYFPAGRTLYATVFMNGQIDFMDASHHDMVVRHERLSPSEVAKVKEAVEAEAFKDFQGIVQSQDQKPHQDYQTNLDVTVFYPDGPRSFTLRGFDAEDGRPLPRVFNEFLCLVDNLKKVEYRLSSGCK